MRTDTNTTSKPSGQEAKTYLGYADEIRHARYVASAKVETRRWNELGDKIAKDHNA